MCWYFLSHSSSGMASMRSRGNCGSSSAGSTGVCQCGIDCVVCSSRWHGGQLISLNGWPGLCWDPDTLPYSSDCLHWIPVHKLPCSNNDDSLLMKWLFALLLVVFWCHVLLAPYTKVEESWTLHAVHDMHTFGISKDVVNTRVCCPAFCNAIQRL